MTSVVLETWWLDESALPDLLWARLRCFSDGRAEVFDLDGNVTSFATAEEARMFLLEDEYAQLAKRAAVLCAAIIQTTVPWALVALSSNARATCSSDCPGPTDGQRHDAPEWQLIARLTVGGLTELGFVPDNRQFGVVSHGSRCARPAQL